MFDMVQAGIPESIIYPYGIPLSEEFLIRHNRKNIMANLGLEDKLTGLIMGGSLGIRSVYNSFKMLLRCEREMQIIVVTGKNAHLRNKMEDQLRHYNITNTKINTNNCTGANTNTTINANAYTGTNTHTYTIDNTDTSTYTYIYNNKNIKILGYTDIIPSLWTYRFYYNKTRRYDNFEALVCNFPNQSGRKKLPFPYRKWCSNIQPKDNIDHILTDILDNTSKIKI